MDFPEVNVKSCDMSTSCFIDILLLLRHCYMKNVTQYCISFTIAYLFMFTHVFWSTSRGSNDQFTATTFIV